MSTQNLSINRYSDTDLEFFKNHISQKLERTEEDLHYTLDRIENMTEAIENEGDWMDDTNSSSELEMLYTLANRLKHHKRDLENALLRVQNKSFGICAISGELIDKRRLMAVPTTTKSLAAKNEEAQAKTIVARKAPSITPPKPAGERVIISRVISKPKAITPEVEAIDFNDDFDEDDDFDNDDFQNIEIEDNNLDD